MPREHLRLRSEFEFCIWKSACQAKLSGDCLIDTALMRRYIARRRWMLLRSVLAMMTLFKPTKQEDLEFEKIVIKHIKKNRLKKCFQKRRKSLKAVAWWLHFIFATQFWHILSILYKIQFKGGKKVQSSRSNNENRGKYFELNCITSTIDFHPISFQNSFALQSWISSYSRAWHY